ncbi:MAG TPA: hypothetical protein DHW71_13060 [Gammaproteobacteria bacterium]|nr:hypothetical protein [Gammaproteobacteria bacterium]MEC8011371.1 glycosyltransferase family 4 protein [Pseudomonadota bacterium]HBF09193.1 hypothetical protein [Gammaproteobacteria bacterium]HCK93921.1 hypothetical protein [Gammaproteobacteria bacterium]|tara:strand:+ start:2252 stop:3421 length:1170 start_codon:yes stop_codon:yes gene_type:complete
MQVVVVSNLYPNSQEPTRGIYTQQLVSELKEQVDVRVIAPLPWRPKFIRSLTNKVGKEVLVPEHEVINGVDVWHPRYFVMPKTARFTYGASFYLGIYNRLKKLHEEKPIDVINVHWAYPDGVGVVYAAKKLGVPVVVHCLGCDINEFAKYPWRREQIAWALQNATMNIYVSQGLADEARALGVKHNRNHVVLNGVDQNKFKAGDKAAVREQLGLPQDKKIVLYAGNFNVEKGLIYLVEAWSQVAEAHSDAVLAVIGSGPEEELVKAKIEELGLGESIKLMGRQPHDQVPLFLQAADILALPSLREGCPNIVLEALSSGAAVIGSKVGAVPELVDETRGILVQPRDSQALGEALVEGLGKDWNDSPWPWMSWHDNALKVMEVYREAVRLA